VEQRLSLVTLGVADLARSRAFYEALGWTTRAEPDDDVVFFQAGGMIVALWGRTELAGDSGVQDEGGWGGVTLAHNVRSPQEVDAVLTEARAAGAAIARPGAATFWGGSEPSRRPAPLPQRRGPGQTAHAGGRRCGAAQRKPSRDSSGQPDLSGGIQAARRRMAAWPFQTSSDSGT